MTAPVVVVGGSLSGLAAAARMAKRGHPVRLLEASAALGGRWAPQPYAGGLVDDAPGVIGFPAPWRDLFRKTGRPLEAELARTGHALVPAPPVRYTFADGTELVLPTDRGEQFGALRQAWGVATAERWRDLVDDLDLVWQAVRPLGLEAELPARRELARDAVRRLTPHRSLEHLARRVGHPQLAALLRSTAYRSGSVPHRTPAWCAVAWSVERRFGRWTLAGGPDTGRLSVLVEALATRLATRRVRVDLEAPVCRIRFDDGRAAGVTLASGEQVDAAAVVCAVNPWTARRLAPQVPGPVRLRPASAPRVDRTVVDEPCATVSETVRLSPAGVPTVRSGRPFGAGCLVTDRDYRDTRPDPGQGVAWAGFRSWFRRPPVTTGVPGLFLAGVGSPAGNDPAALILSGALAAYGVDRSSL